MPSHDHDALKRHIESVDAWPEADVRTWLSGGPQLSLLRGQRTAPDVILYAAGRATFVHSVLMSNSALDAATKSDLLSWSGNPYSMMSYVYGGPHNEMWIDNSFESGPSVWANARQMIFIRKLPDYPSDASRAEILQEFEQVEGLHRLAEERAFCKLNDQGDLEHIVSYTLRDSFDAITLVSCRWSELERYMAVTNQTLVQMFDFTRVKRGQMAKWDASLTKTHKREKRFFYSEEIHSDSSWTRGVQLLPLRRPKKAILAEYQKWPWERKPTDFADFLAYDWRNRKLSRISTAPGATTNYFDANTNDKPYELSPAFFRAEVLSKYRSDKDKYRFQGDYLSCRNSWSLRGVEVNDAGQVHAYICDLAKLPLSEQLHWKSFNEPPKGVEKGPIPFISTSAFERHFLNRWTTETEPLDQVRAILRRWESVAWWRLRDDNAMDHVVEPLADSIDEWSDAFLELSKLVVEGFQVSELRRILDREGVQYTKDQKSITLLERLIGKFAPDDAELTCLREVQAIRSKGRSHAARDQLRILAKKAKTDFDSYRNHFRTVCGGVALELEKLDAMLKTSIPNKP